MLGQTIVNGLLLGGLYAIASIGFSMVWGVMGIINLAHGAFIMVGAYASYALFTYAGIDPFVSIPASMLLLQIWPNPPQGPLYAFAVLSSLAANLTLLGSFASLIAVERAEALGVNVTFAEYARAGVPFTLISLFFAVVWLAWTGWLPLFPGAAGP